MEIKDLSYKIHYDDNDNSIILKYTLDDEPWEFVDPSNIQVGDVIFYDKEEYNRFGIVMNIDKRKFTYYEVSNGSEMNLTEIAEFRVFKVSKGERNV